MNLSKFSVKKPVTIIMAVLIILILGVVSLTNLTTDLFPSMNFPYAVVITSYIGASPDEVELIVTKPIESSMATVGNIKNINSISRENMSVVILEYNSSADMDTVMLEMRENLDMITSYMPDGVSSPTIMKINPDMMPVMAFSISFEGKSTAEIEDDLDKIVPRFERIEGVASVSTSGTAQNEIQVLLNENKISNINKLIQNALNSANNTGAQQAAPSFSVTSDMIKGILAGQNFSMPAGYISDSGIDYLVRTGDKLEDIEAVKNLPVMVLPFMTVKLSDVADVNMINTLEESYTKVNGENAVTLTIQKQTEFATTDVSKEINKVIDEITKENSDIEIVSLLDQAEYINTVLDTTTMNLILGALLALLVLWLFLRDFKPTFIISVAIPISVVTAFIMIYFFDITLNIVSLGGLALGIGMLVDNSIVVIENIYRLKHNGENAKKAAIKGAKQVSGAITASTLTTISVFLPIVFMKGLTAQIFKEMALTITFSLLASLLIALSFVPMAASRLMEKDIERSHKGLDAVKKIYTKVLNFSLRHRAAVILITLLLFAGSIFGSLKMGTEFFPATDEGEINITLNMPKGSEFDATSEMLDKTCDIISKIEGVQTISASIGGGGIGSFIMRAGSDDTGSITVLLDENTNRKTSEVADEIREKIQNPDCETIVEEQSTNMMAMGSSEISIEITGHDFDMLEKTAAQVADIVQSVEGTTDINNGISKTSPELKITVDREKSLKNNMTTAQVFAAVRNAIANDDTATSISINGNEYDVRVISGNNDTLNIDDIKNLSITNPLGNNIIISDIADVSIENGYSSINRTNQERTLTVSASIDEGYNIGLVGRKVTDKLSDFDVPSGYSIKMTGENEQITSAFKDLILAMLLAVVLIYMVMAAQFQSYLYPFIVMFCIPLAFTGGFIALLITSTPLSIVAFIGLIILAGVVVNNGIVLIDYINQLKAEGMPTEKALIEAGNTRLRPIVMTALTTILALSTMSIGIGKGSEMMQPMAVTAIGGLIFATIMTLIVIPVMYSGFDKRKAKRKNKKALKEAVNTNV